MPRSISINGMRAILLHNVFKQSKRLTNDDKNAINDYVMSLSLNELKQKGMTKQIVDKFKNMKPRKTISGGMKRKFDPGKKVPLHWTKKIIRGFRGKTTNDDEYTIEQHKQYVKQFLNDKREYKKEYENAKIQTRIAHQQEEIAKNRLEASEREYKLYLEGLQKIVLETPSIKDYLENQHKKYASKYHEIQKERNEGFKDVSYLNSIIEDLEINNILYRTLTGNDLPPVEEQNEEEEHIQPPQPLEPPRLPPIPSPLLYNHPPSYPPPFPMPVPPAEEAPAAEAEAAAEAAPEQLPENPLDRLQHILQHQQHQQYHQ